MSVARENFLEKLKREREEAQKLNSSKKCSEKQESTSVSINNSLHVLPKITTKESSSSSSSSEESSDDEPPQNSSKPSVSKQHTKKKASSSSSSNSDSESGSDQDDLILRKKSKSFVQNGKVSSLCISISNTELNVMLGHFIPRFFYWNLTFLVSFGRLKSIQAKMDQHCM